MKNGNYKYDRKFNNQVNHLQSFIGMPMWNGRAPTLSEIREYDRRLIEQQLLSAEVKKQSLLIRLFEAVKIQSEKAFALVVSAKEKTKKVQREMGKPINSKVECCG